MFFFHLSFTTFSFCLFFLMSKLDSKPKPCFCEQHISYNQIDVLQESTFSFKNNMQSYLVVILQTPVLGSPILVDPHLSQQHADLQDAVFRLQQEVKKPKASPSPVASSSSKSSTLFVQNHFRLQRS